MRVALKKTMPRQPISGIKLFIVLFHIIQELGSPLWLRDSWLASVTSVRVPHGRIDDLNCRDHLIASSRVKDPILSIKLSHFLTARSTAFKSENEKDVGGKEKRASAKSGIKGVAGRLD